MGSCFERPFDRARRRLGVRPAQGPSLKVRYEHVSGGTQERQTFRSEGSAELEDRNVAVPSYDLRSVALEEPVVTLAVE